MRRLRVIMIVGAVFLSCCPTAMFSAGAMRGSRMKLARPHGRGARFSAPCVPHGVDYIIGIRHLGRGGGASRPAAA